MTMTTTTTSTTDRPIPNPAPSTYFDISPPTLPPVPVPTSPTRPCPLPNTPSIHTSALAEDADDERARPPQKELKLISTSNSLLNLPNSCPHLKSNRTLSVTQGCIQALLSIDPLCSLHTYIVLRFCRSTKLSHNPSPCVLAFTSHFHRWAHPPR